jgi:hypothetical protein
VGGSVVLGAKGGRDRPCSLVLSSHSLYALAAPLASASLSQGDTPTSPSGADPYHHLAVAYSGALADVQAWEIGLGRQTLLLRFGGRVRVLAQVIHRALPGCLMCVCMCVCVSVCVFACLSVCVLRPHALCICPCLYGRCDPSSFFTHMCVSVCVCLCM